MDINLLKSEEQIKEFMFGCDRDFLFSIEEMTKIILIIGAPGTGKTYRIR